MRSQLYLINVAPTPVFSRLERLHDRVLGLIDVYKRQQFSTGANSHYDGLQLSAMKRLGHGLMGQINYTWSPVSYTHLDVYKRQAFPRA